jgi:hypothetical protein
VIRIASTQRLVEAHDPFVELALWMSSAPAPHDHGTYVIVVSVSIDSDHVEVKLTDRCCRIRL